MEQEEENCAPRWVRELRPGTEPSLHDEFHHAHRSWAQSGLGSPGSPRDVIRRAVLLRNVERFSLSPALDR